ncbi:MAG: TetR/AcrR family transcriptional regulator [Coriobacteriales bacterium]
MADGKGKGADPRALYSRKMLKEALLELVAGQPLDTLTPTAVAARAQLARGTFYRHFSSVEALAEEAVADFIEELRALLKALGFTEPRHSGSLAAPFCQFVRKSSRYGALLLDRSAEDIVVAQLLRAGQGRFAQNMGELHGMSPRQSEAVVRFQVAGYLALCREYANVPEDEWAQMLLAVDGVMRRGLGGAAGRGNEGE